MQRESYSAYSETPVLGFSVRFNSLLADRGTDATMLFVILEI